MSEYQYYEFQAIDRPLTEREMATLRGYSSRATIAPTRFVNNYSYGNFKGNASEWMEKYFDAFLFARTWRAATCACSTWPGSFAPSSARSTMAIENHPARLSSASLRPRSTRSSISCASTVT